MPIITLINDWKQDALYLSQIKGALLSVDEHIRIINLTPNLSTFDEFTAAFVLKNSFKQFPKGTIHLNFISHYEKNVTDFLIAQYHEQFFVSRNTGFLANVFDTKPEKLFRLDIEENSFTELELYPLILRAILKNALHKIADQYEISNRNAVFLPVFNDNNIIIHIIYIDVYGNLITNLKKNDFYNFIAEKNFKIVIENKKNSIEKISSSYENIEQGDLFAIFNNLDLLEIGMKSANMAKLFSIKKSDELFIEIINNLSAKPGNLF